jgi:hypothetical protein
MNDVEINVLVEVGMSAGPVGFDVEQQALIWAMWRRGDRIADSRPFMIESG